MNATIPVTRRPVPSRDLLWALVRRNLRLRSRRRAFGLAWLPLAPLAQFVVLTVVFTRVVPVGIAHYPAFLLTGLLAWRWFADVMRDGCASLTGAPDLVLRPGFPVAVLPAVAVVSGSATAVLTLPVLLAVVVIDTGHLSLSILALPVIAVVQALLMLGPVSLLAVWHSKLRDVGSVVSAALVPLFYATPIFYAPEALPDRIGALAALSPISRLLTAYRAVLVDGRWPDPVPLVVMGAAGILCMLVGVRAVRRAVPTLADSL